VQCLLATDYTDEHRFVFIRVDPWLYRISRSTFL
jgi:hypothetical protein